MFAAPIGPRKTRGLVERRARSGGGFVGSPFPSAVSIRRSFLGGGRFPRRSGRATFCKNVSIFFLPFSKVRTVEEEFIRTYSSDGSEEIWTGRSRCAAKFKASEGVIPGIGCASLLPEVVLDDALAIADDDVSHANMIFRFVGMRNTACDSAHDETFDRTVLHENVCGNGGSGVSRNGCSRDGDNVVASVFGRYRAGRSNLVDPRLLSSLVQCRSAQDQRCGFAGRVLFIGAYRQDPNSNLREFQ